MTEMAETGRLRTLAIDHIRVGRWADLVALEPDLTNAEIRAHLRFDRNATVEGTIRLEGATIHGMLALNGQTWAGRRSRRAWTSATRPPRCWPTIRRVGRRASRSPA